MGQITEISWTDSTFNPWWGCQRVSAGCEHCYAETFAKRTGKAEWGPQAERRLFGDKHWAEPLKWNAAALKSGKRHLVFCASMADVFEDRRDLDAQRERLWALIEATPALTWQLLTKRPQNMARLVPARWAGGWPSNVWPGATTEDDRRAAERIAHLRVVPAAVKFISAEPLLGPITADLSGIQWGIVGGESGARARPFDLDWARAFVAACRAAGVAPFVKQMGARISVGGIIGAYQADLGDGWTGPVRDRKGGDISEFPEDLRVREFPR